MRRLRFAFAGVTATPAVPVAARNNDTSAISSLDGSANRPGSLKVSDGDRVSDNGPRLNLAISFSG